MFRTAGTPVYTISIVLPKPRHKIYEPLGGVISAKTRTLFCNVFSQLSRQIRNRQGVASEVKKMPRKQGELVALTVIFAVGAPLKSVVREIFCECRLLIQLH